MSYIVAFMRQMAYLLRKETLSLVKDPSTRFLLITPALMQALLFGYGTTFDLTTIPYAVVDHSHSRESGRLLARIDGTGLFKRVAAVENSNVFPGLINEGMALIVVTFPADFEDRLVSGRDAPVQAIVDGRNSSTSGLAMAYLNSLVLGFNQMRGNTVPVTIEQRAWFNPNLDSRWHLMPPLIAALSMIQTVLLSALSVAREREQGTFDQLLVTPLTPFQILIGKALPCVLVGLLQSTIILLVTTLWFRIPMSGGLWLMYLGLTVFTLASVGIGLSISAFSMTMQQAMLYSFMVTMPLILLSGLLTPISNMPRVLQIATYANPLRLGIDLVRRVYLEDAGMSDVVTDFGPLIAVCIVTLSLAGWLFRNRLG